MDLVIPGLLDLDPPSAWKDEVFLGWQRLLAKGRQIPDARGQETLLADLLGFQSLGFTASAQTDAVSYAALRWAGQQGSAPSMAGCTQLLCADPLWLVADKDRVLVQEARWLQLQPAECDAILQAVNQHFAEDGFRMVQFNGRQGYLCADRSRPLRTVSLSELLYRNLDQFFPEGDEQRPWRGLLNELQMLFHHLPLNEQRDAQGLPLCNGLWLWGDQKFLPLQKPNYAKVSTDDGFAAGMALHWDLPVSNPTHQADAQTLILLDSLQAPAAAKDWDQWQEHWSATVVNVLRTVQQQLGSGQLTSCRIFPCKGSRIEISKWDLWKFWK